MFGITPNEMANSGGAAPDPNTVPMRPAPSFGENTMDIAVSGSMGHGSELGANILGGQEMQRQYDAVRKYDPDFASTLPNPGHSALPDVMNGMFTGKPKVGTFASKLIGGGIFGAQSTLEDAVKGQQMIEEWKKAHPDADVPSINKLIENVKFTQDTLDQEAAEATQRSSGINLPLVGKVTGAGLAGGILASTQLSNPTQAAFNLALAGTGGITKDLIGNVGGRIAANAAANGVVSAISQSVIAAPAASQYGVERDYKQEAFGVLSNVLLGGILSGVHEAVGSYFPATTKPGMREVHGAVDEVKTQGGPIGDVVKDLATAKTPDELQAKVAELPLETRLDVLHEVSPNPSAEERGVINAGERELVIDKGAKEVGMEVPEAAQHAAEVVKAIETNRPIPETPLRGNEKLPPNLAGAKPRYGYQDKQFTIDFKSDIDKALYITAQQTKSKMDEWYRAFLRQNNLTDEQINVQGAALREQIKKMAKDAPPGQLTVENARATATPAASATKPIAAPRPAAGPKYPVRAWLRRKGGVRTGSVLAQELNSMGINQKTAPGLFRNMGKMADVDNIPHREWDLSHAPTDETGNYVDRQYILNALESEIKGKPVTNQEHVPEALGGHEPGSREDLEQYAHSLGIDTEGKSVEQALAEIKEQEARLQAAKDEVDTVGVREEANENDSVTDAKYQAIEDKVAPKVEKTEAGEQAVIPGAEKLSDKLLAERGMEGGLKSEKPQKGADEGLFDVAGRGQEDMFSNLKPTDAAPVSDEKAMTVKDAIDDIQEHENLIKAMTTCSIE